MAHIACIEDLRRLARRRVPKMFYDYADAGSWTETTYRANTRDFGDLLFRQRVAVDIERRNLRSTMIGQDVAMPVALAPIGMCGMQRADGEILAARAAEAFGVPFCLSTMSICSIEDVATHTSRPFWFQLYVMRDRAFVERLIDRAGKSKCSALVVTLDLPMLGQRHKDLRNGLSAPPKPGLANLLDLARKPKWGLAMLRTRRRTFGNVVGHVTGVENMASLEAWTSSQFDPRVTWEDIAWIRRLWQGKLVLKGIMDIEDARRAVDVGADAIVVSNHGGRQLDGAPSSISTLPAIARAVGGSVETWLDGGVRSGQDVLKAIALGARGVMIGRAYLYGLGALGEEGVRLCLEIIAKELSLTMGFCGVVDINAVTVEILIRRRSATGSNYSPDET
ncbi:alpha-hydroxy acid oxidase [Methylocystis sp. ATCC 49242]|uniref:alpha-hydroxy acid oxidase n=1 Tax=Methylocystis sp. ATCC 49242 TaxID=622637 RepID=UPI0001F8860C|nr:alpha-hydroxy acid oxidase [Methylocystis sp. ATCC 49242]